MAQQGGPEHSNAVGGTHENQQAVDAAWSHKAIAPFERAYLSHSLNRMFDPVQLVFTAGSRTPPSVDEVVNICKTITKELHVTATDPRLAVPMARNVAKTANLYVFFSCMCVCVYVCVCVCVCVCVVPINSD